MSSPLTTDRQQAHSKQSPKSIIYSPLRKQQLVTEDAISAISSKSVGAKSPCSFSHSSPKATSSSSSSPHHGSQTPVKSILERQIHLVIIDEVYMIRITIMTFVNYFH